MLLLYNASGQCGIEHRMPCHPDTRSRSVPGDRAGSPSLSADGGPECPPAASGPDKIDLRRPHSADLNAAADRDPAFDADRFRVALVEMLPDLKRFAESMAETADQAEDLVQETLLRAWLCQDRFRPRSNLRAWTFTIMRSSLSPSKRETADPTDVGNAAPDRRRIDPDR
ncbi:sigma factor [Methylobacterium sp. D53M]|jgi:hypothetical protein